MEQALITLGQFNITINEHELWTCVRFNDTRNFDSIKSKIESILNSIGITYIWNETVLLKDRLVTLTLMKFA